jgi:hypothetical protein
MLSLAHIAIEDIPQLVLLFFYSSSITGWSLTAVLSGSVAFVAVSGGIAIYSWTLHKSKSFVELNGFGSTVELT